MSEQKQVLEILRESLQHGHVQHGIVSSIKPVFLPNQVKTELVVIDFLGQQVFCKKEDFIKRKISTLNGFMGTRVPFLVQEINAVGIVVNRVKAMQRLAKRFVRTIQEGDVVTGSVTSVTENGLVFIEVDGVDIVVPRNEWDRTYSINLRNYVRIGMEVDVKITTIEEVKGDQVPNDTGDKDEHDTDVEKGFKIRASRKAILSEQISEIWDDIERYHNLNDRVTGKIVGYTQGRGSYFVEVKGTRIILMCNLGTSLRRQYQTNLPNGLNVHLQITKLDKESKRGKARIYDIDRTLSATLGYGGNRR